MPLLVCDRPDPEEQVTHYTLVGLPGNPQVPISDHAEYGLRYDLAGVPPGEYRVTVSACNDWQCSLPASIDFFVPGRPSPPRGLRIG